MSATPAAPPTPRASSASPAPTPNQKYRLAVESCVALHAALNAYLIGRDDEIRLALTAIVARKNLLLLGPPGVAKTLVGYLVGKSIMGGSYFELLLGRFTEPSQVFGPISIRELRDNDRVTHKVEGFLPTARVALLDEVFKASSAILNSLLTIMNERVFHNGGVRMETTLDTLFGCSNEMPESSALEALYDRFLIRHEVIPVPEADEDRLLLLGDVPALPKIVHLDEMQDRARKIPLTPQIIAAMKGIRKAAKGMGINVSDRRFRESVSVVRASAALAGRDEIIPRDLGILQHVYWQTPDQIPSIKLLVKKAVEGAEKGINPLPTGGGAPPPKPGNPPKPPASPPTLTPRELFSALQKQIMTSSAATVNTDAALHSAIDHLLSISNQINASEAEEVRMWKANISQRAPWLAGRGTI